MIVHKYDFDKIQRENVRLLTDDEVKCFDALRNLESQNHIIQSFEKGLSESQRKSASDPLPKAKA